VDKEKIKSKLVELRKAKNKSRNQMADEIKKQIKELEYLVQTWG